MPRKKKEVIEEIKVDENEIVNEEVKKEEPAELPKEEIAEAPIKPIVKKRERTGVKLTRRDSNMRTRNRMLTVDAPEAEGKRKPEEDVDETNLMHSYQIYSAAGMPQTLTEKTKNMLVLKGKLKAFQRAERGNGKSVTLAIIYYGENQHQILIPANDYYTDFDTLTTAQIRERLSHSIGADVFFVVTNFMTDVIPGVKRTYIGSRILGMQQLVKENWFTIAKGKFLKGGAPMMLIEENDVIEASVTSVTKRVVFVQVFGAETQIHVKELSHAFISDATASGAFYPGQHLPVRLLKISRNQESNSVEYTASAKQAEENPQMKYFGRYFLDSDYEGVVTNIDINNENGLTVYVNLDGQVDVYAKIISSIRRVPQINDKVLVSISGKDESTGRIWGKIIRIQPSGHGF